METDVTDVDLKDFKIEEEDIKDHTIRSRGSVRLSMGLCWTSDEWESYRRDVLNQKMC